MKRNSNLPLQKKSGVKNITIKNKNIIKSKECLDIGKIKVWKKKCPECKNLITFINYNSYKFSIKNNGRCKYCVSNDLNRCKKISNAVTKRQLGSKLSEKTKEKLSLKFLGKNNPMYGTDGGMFGKKHSNISKEKQSLARKSYWDKKRILPRNKFQEYRDSVDCLTRKQPIHLLENSNKRGKAGIEGAFHLDHIISVWYGYHHNIPAEEIANIKNLRFIHWLENQKKWCN
jgi:hypothetical protein